MNQPVPPLQTLTEKLITRKEGAIGWIIFSNPARHIEKRKPAFKGR